MRTISVIYMPAKGKYPILCKESLRIIKTNKLSKRKISELCELFTKGKPRLVMFYECNVFNDTREIMADECFKP